jgi:hydrogenase nickel incorporation protein HypA/HybF
MGLCETIVETVLRAAGGRPVTSARVRVGGHPVDPVVIDQGFRLAAAGTPAADATIELVIEPLTVHCRNCGAGAPVASALDMAACSRCGGVDVAVTGAEYAVLDAIAFGTPDGSGAPDA